MLLVFINLQVHHLPYVLLLFSFLFLLSTAIDIGFTVPTINHTEEFRQFDTIINKSRVSEQTFELRIQITTVLSGVGRRATPGQDFVIRDGSNIVTQLMNPNENSINFAYRIREDSTPENQEVFQLFVTPNPGTPAFGCDINRGCHQRIEIVIIDDDGEFLFLPCEEV